MAGALAQRLLDLGRWGGLAWALYLLAAVLFGLASRPGQEEAPAGEFATPLRLRWPWAVAAAVLAALAWARLGGNRFTDVGAAAWGGALMCAALAVWPVRDPGGAAPRRQGLSLPWPALALLASLLLAAFFRLHRIHTIPLEMGCDLPLIQGNIAQILAGEYPIFFTSHPGREGLFFYLAAPVATLAGLGHVSIKVTSALVGLLTLPAIYWLGRELRDRWTGALAAFLLAISHWHIILTRVGYRAALMPLLLTLAWLFLLRGLQRGRSHDYALCGLWVGLGLQSYNAFMVVPPLFAGLLLIAWAARRRLGAAIQGRAILVWAAVTFFAALPLARYAYDAPQSYLFRAATRATSLEQPLPGDLAATLAGNVARAAAMFHQVGDVVYLSNVPHYRQLGFATGVLFALGLGYAVANWRRSQLWIALPLLLGMLMPSIMALAFPQEVPSAVRAIGAVPVAVLLAALALRHLLAALRAWRGPAATGLGRKAGRAGLALVGLALVGGLAIETYSVDSLYFERYVWHQPAHNQSISLKIAQAIDGFEGNGPVYLMIWPHWYDGNAVRAQLRRTPGWDNERWELTPGEPPLDGALRRVLVIMHPEEGATLELLRAHYTHYVVLEDYWEDGSVALRMFVGER
jgi:4-amino-4-deoxy-L-arabinose transferase-like glycosyltransferase